MPVLQKCSLVILLLMTTFQIAAAPQKMPEHWCMPKEAAWLIADARHDDFERYLARERQAGRLLEKAAPTLTQEGQVAILNDNGTVTRPANPFDLQGKSIQFFRRPKGMSAVRSALGFKQLIGDQLDLGDDDSIEVQFPNGFEFAFGDQVYTSAFVNSNGSVTFGEADRFLFFGGLLELLIGPPRIAPLLMDLDPSAAEGEGGVYVNFLPHRMRVTWLEVPEYDSQNSNTVQVTLFDTGRINIVYGEVDALEPTVGVQPFDEFALTLLDFESDLPLSPRRTTIGQQFTAAPEVDDIGVVQLFAEHFSDIYTSVFLWLDFPAITAGFANTLIMQNDVEGIGSNVYDFTSFFVPASRNLESYIQMGDLSRFPDDPDEIFFDTASTMTIVGHEFGHRWLTDVSFLDANGEASNDLLAIGSGHWNHYTNSEGSLMHGNAWDDNADGTFSATQRAHTRYSPLDRYLMGLAGPASVPDSLLHHQS